MKHTITLRNGVMLHALITVFEKKGFIRIGKKVFKVIGYRPGPGAAGWDCEFDLEDYIEGQTADAMIILPADTPHVVVRPTWNGPEDGLPPVGLEVEYEPKAGDADVWRKGQVIGHLLDGAVIADCNGDHVELCYDNYRPIRTAEQLAAEERERQCLALAKATGLTPGAGRVKAAISLYEAGARMPSDSKFAGNKP